MDVRFERTNYFFNNDRTRLEQRVDVQFSAQMAEFSYFNTSKAHY